MVFSDSIAIVSSNTYFGPVAYITILKTQLTVYRLWTEKHDERGVDFQEYGELHLTLTNHWEILLHKSYSKIQATIVQLFQEKKLVMKT